MTDTDVLTRSSFGSAVAPQGPIFQQRHTHGASESRVDACPSVHTGARANTCPFGHVPTALAGTQRTTSTAHAPYGACATPPALHTTGASHRRRPTPPAPHTAGAPHRRHATPPTGMHARAASGASIYACALCFSPPVRPCAGLRHTGKPFLGRVQGALSPHLPLGAVSFDATVVLPLCCFFWLPCHETAVAP